MSTYPEEFSSLEKENKQLQVKNRQLIKTLETIATHETRKPGRDDGICLYGCDCPGIAKDALIELSKSKPTEATNIEIICAKVHKAYCDEKLRQGKEAYWTGGDYSKLDESTKDYDRATVRAVLQAIGEGVS